MKKVISIKDSKGVALDGMEVVAGIYSLVETKSIATMLSTAPNGAIMMDKENTITNGTSAKYYLPSGNTIITTQSLYDQSRTSSVQYDEQTVDAFTIDVIEKSTKPKLFNTDTWKQLQASELLSSIVDQASEAMVAERDLEMYEILWTAAKDNLNGVVDYQGRAIPANANAIEVVSALDIEDPTKLDETLAKLDKLIINLRTSKTIGNQRNISKDKLCIIAAPKVVSLWKNKLVKIGSAKSDETFKEGYKGHYDGIAVFETLDDLPTGVFAFVTVKGVNQAPFYNIELENAKNTFEKFTHLVVHYKGGAGSIVPENVYALASQTTRKVVTDKKTK